MDKRLSDRLTIAGIVLFVILCIVYLLRDNIMAIFAGVSVDRSSGSISLPANIMPNFSLDWFYAMDTPSQMIFAFLVIILVATIIGGTVLYMKYRKQKSS